MNGAPDETQTHSCRFASQGTHVNILSSQHTHTLLSFKIAFKKNPDGIYIKQ